MASPHYRFGDTVRVISNASVDAVGPAGAVWASVADMARWMRFVLDSGLVDGRRLLKSETYAELFKPETMVTPVYPVIQYGHDAKGGDSIGSGFVYSGKKIPALRGKYIFTDLTTGRLWYADYKDMLAADDSRPGTVAAPVSGSTRIPPIM